MNKIQIRFTDKSVKEEENLANRSSDEDKIVFQEIIIEIKEKLLEILSIKTENKELVGFKSIETIDFQLDIKFVLHFQLI